MKSIGSIFIALFFSFFSFPAHANEEALRGLMAEASDFQAQYAKANRTQGQIEAAEKDLSGSELAVKEAIGDLRNGGLPGKNPPPNRCAQKSADTRVTYACDTETAKVNGWRVDLLGQADGEKKYAEQLNREMERLNQIRTTWVNKKKSNKALLEVLDVAFQSWQRRYAALVFKSPSYNRLISTKEGAAQCKTPAASGREAILEGAQSCLQWLWISAKQNS